ncbi:helix-turn-helix transcriptional regulator [Ulvibacterium marinum]|uniref:AraC family transcriptional regulator n=1 Tax=Ulvibacterium marinum TaxID=2419782 RepID=A0A3B0BSB5_9FLAO|nr:AraC family transcriptional regulator [Ulvibacterium marinum]RKN75139.1 AraC family transcriptional regulator [Ulvibacterium marinum]
MKVLSEGQFFGKSLKIGSNDVFEFSLTEYGKDSFINYHYHTNNYLSVLVEGSYLEKNKQEILPIKSGDILFRPYLYSHQNLFINSKGTCFNVEFKMDWEQKLGIKLKLPKKYVRYESATLPSLFTLLRGFKLGIETDITSELIYDWLFTANQKNLNHSHLPCVSSAAKILDGELSEYHSLKGIAERIHVHPVYLARAFKKKKGLTVGEYQLRSKLTNAVFLLLNTSKTISDISFENGFYDDAHFIRSFKATYKISPYQFRLQIKS